MAIAEMSSAIRARLAERGLDAREHAIVSYGGCTGLFAAELAREIGARKVLIPELASVLSAFGAANADVRRERTRAVSAMLPCDPKVLHQLTEALRLEVEGDLERDGIEPARRSISFVAEVHLKRQKWELAIPFVGTGLDGAAQEKLVSDFRAEYVKRYGEGALMGGAPVELVALRAIGVGSTTKASLHRADSAGIVPNAAVRETRSRKIAVARNAPAQSVDVVDWESLAPDEVLRGPILIDCSDTTLWLPQGTTAGLDSWNNLVIEIFG